MRNGSLNWGCLVALVAMTPFVPILVGSGIDAGASVSSEYAGFHVLPVGACAYLFGPGANGTRQAWVPNRIAAEMPTASVRSLEFYSVGTERYLGTVETILGPRGWTCGQLTAEDGSAGMAVYPPGSPDPIFSPSGPGTPPKPGERLVEARFDYTGHLPGFDLACPYFPSIPTNIGVKEPCQATVPKGEEVTHLTPDVVAITDPAGIKGSLAGSGGSRRVIGLMIAPEGSGLPGSVGVAEISCSLRSASLCSTIVSDFVARQFPVPQYPAP